MIKGKNLKKKKNEADKGGSWQSFKEETFLLMEEGDTWSQNNLTWQVWYRLDNHYPCSASSLYLFWVAYKQKYK